MNIWDILHKNFIGNAENISICNSKGECLSYGNLLDKTLELADLILSHTPQGSRVAILNSHSYFDALGVLGTLAADCTVIPLSLNYGEPNCCHIINNIEPDIILTNYKSMPDSIENMIKKKNTKILTLSDDKTYKKIIRTRDLTFKNNIAMIMSTSGTTGIPKGVVLSHKNIISNIFDIGEYFSLKPQDHLLIARPLYHGAVMTGEFLHGLTSGCKITFYSEVFNPRKVVRFMEEIKCTTMAGTPTLFFHLNLHKKNLELSCLKKIVVSGECLLPKVAEVLINGFPNTDFYNVYGLTEASPRVSYLEPKYFSKKIGSVGQPLRSVDIKIIDEKGNHLPALSVGEIIVKGPNVMQGYWRDKEETEKMLKDSWLYTKDIGYFDEEGFLYVIGRKDHMIIRAGVNIYPQEIENILLQDESIKEVMAWGEPDPKYGQRIFLAFVPSELSNINRTYIVDICRKKLQPFMWPDEVYLIDKLSRNASGKLIRGRPSNLR